MEEFEDTQSSFEIIWPLVFWKCSLIKIKHICDSSNYTSLRLKSSGINEIRVEISFKVEKILKDSLDSIPSPSPSVKIQIIGGTVYFKSLLKTPSNVLPLHRNQTFLPIIWIFTEGEGDRIESRLPFKIFSTLKMCSFDLVMSLKILSWIYFFLILYHYIDLHCKISNLRLLKSKFGTVLGVSWYLLGQCVKCMLLSYLKRKKTKIN